MPGTYSITTSHIGYQMVTLSNIELKADEQRIVDIELVQTPVQTEQVIVTASRREQNLQEVPVSISTISAQSLVDHACVTVDDALRYVPGVNMMQDQVNIRGSTGYSRGVGARVLVLIDGLPYITGDTGEINWETLPIHQIERIEVVKGAGSALYGSSALGGVINIITKDIGEHTLTQFRIYSGLYDESKYPEWQWSKKPRFSSGGFISFESSLGDLGYLLSIARSVDESYRENDVYHRWNFYTKLRYTISQYQTLSLTANLLTRSHGNFFWWRSLKEATKPADTQLNGNVDSKRGNLSLSYREFLSKDFFYTIKGIYFGNFWKDDSAGRQNNISESHVTYLETQATYAIASSHFLTLGFAVNYDHIFSDIFGTHPGVGVAAFMQHEYAILEPLKITTGFRYDWQKVSALPSATQLSPKLGVLLSISPSLNIRTSIGMGFRYPSISELFTSVTTGVSQVKIVPNDSLKAERSFSIEAGLNYSWKDRFAIECALFHNGFSDLIEAGVDPNRLVIQFANVTKARIRGIEAGIKSNWFNRFLLTDINYTYVDPVDLNQNTVLKFRPRHLLYISTGMSHQKFDATIDYRYISRVEQIDENLVRFAPIIHGDHRVPIKVFDIGMGYVLSNWGIPLKVSFNIKNLFNYYYVELIGNLAPVRTFFLSVEGAF